MSYFYGGSSSTNFAGNCLEEDELIKTKGNSPVFQDRGGGKVGRKFFRTEIRLSSRSVAIREIDLEREKELMRCVNRNTRD